MANMTSGPLRSIPVELSDKFTCEQVSDVEVGMRAAKRSGLGGALEIAIGADYANQKVIVDFGRLVRWITCTPSETKALAVLLMKHAESVLEVM